MNHPTFQRHRFRLLLGIAVVLAVIVAARMVTVPGSPAAANGLAMADARTAHRQSLTPRTGGRPTTEAEPAIVGGTAVPVGTYQFMTFLHLHIGASTYVCGGALIDSLHILTAAHCLEEGGIDATSATAYIGGNAMSGYIPQGAIVRSASALQRHPSYTPGSEIYDVAVVTLSQAVTTISPLPFVAANSSTGLATGTMLTVAGWGTTSFGGPMATQLMEVDVPVQSDATCASSYGSGYYAATMFCAGPMAGGQDSCQGDSGGPIFYDNGGSLVEVGIVSWGNNCALANYPGVYTRIANASVNAFIQSIISSATPTPIPTATPTPDATGPTVKIVKPAKGASVKSPFTAEVSASDPSGVRSVQMQKCDKSGCTTFKTDTSAPYTFKVKGKRGKKMTVRAVATDTRGNVGTSSKVTVKVT